MYLVLGASGSGKTNTLLNLVRHQLDIDICLGVRIHTSQNISISQKVSRRLLNIF